MAVHAALGIPFATAERFDPPQPVGFSGAAEGGDFGPACPQPPGEVFMASDQPKSEDCLTLNVWTPSFDDARARPVMVWIHGGGFRQGAGSHFLSRGQVLAERGDVVVVTINYRLGCFGFLGSRNCGVLDMMAALAWVRDHIGAFGGDPQNVTIFGESAGGAAVSLLCSTSQADGLFDRAIVQSGGALVSTAERSARLEAALRAKGDIESMTADELVAAQMDVEKGHGGGGMAFLPTADGVLLPTSPAPSSPVPMLFGTNVDETRLLGTSDPHRLDLDEAGLLRRLERSYGSRSSSVADAVRSARAARGEGTTPSDLWYAIETERFFRVPTLRDADAHASFGHPTWTYLFEWRSPMLDGWLGACHVLEIPFVFGLQGSEGLADFTGSGPEADALSAEVMGAWVGFARTGELPWPQHDPDTRPTWVFGAPSRLEHAPRDAERVAVATALS